MFGTGGIGLNACMGAAFAGAMPVIAIDPTRLAVNWRGICGATHVIDPTDCDVLIGNPQDRAGRRGCGRRGDRHSHGDGAGVERDTAAGRPRGCHRQREVRCIADPRSGVFNQGKSLLGTWGGDSVPDRDYNRFWSSVLFRPLRSADSAVVAL